MKPSESDGGHAPPRHPIVLLGPDGQVGWELRRALAPLGPLLALSRHDGADLTDPEALAARLAALGPRAIVNAAAHTAVDRAESEPDLARRINADAPAALARVARETGAWLVHYSTDYVFDGSGDAPRDEDAPTGPLSVYGRTKLGGEDAVRASGAAHLILRTSWVHAARGGNFARTMLRLAATRDALAVVDDQIGAPTSAELIADATAHALKRVLDADRGDRGGGGDDPAATGLAGTYHLAASGATSWRDYARRVIARAAARGAALRCAADAVRGIPTREYPTPAARPLNSRLATGRFERAFGLTLPPWQHGVDRLVDEIVPLTATTDPAAR